MKTNNVIAISITLVLLLALMIICGSAVYKFFFGYYHETKLADNTLIASDWIEIESRGRIKVEYDDQFIEIRLSPPSETWNYNGIKSISGEVVNPEIVLIDAEGKEYQLTRYSATRSGDSECAEYWFPRKLPRNAVYTKVMFRSKSPIQAKAILWAGYNFKDMT